MENTLQGLYRAIGCEDWEVARDASIELKRFRAIEAGKENATEDEIERLVCVLCPGQDRLTYLHFQKR